MREEKRKKKKERTMRCLLSFRLLRRFPTRTREGRTAKERGKERKGRRESISNSIIVVISVGGEGEKRRKRTWTIDTSNRSEGGGKGKRKKKASSPQVMKIRLSTACLGRAEREKKKDGPSLPPLLYSGLSATRCNERNRKKNRSYHCPSRLFFRNTLLCQSEERRKGKKRERGKRKKKEKGERGFFDLFFLSTRRCSFRAHLGHGGGREEEKGERRGKKVASLLSFSSFSSSWSRPAPR